VQQDITASFDRLCSILMHFLDACDADGDVACAKMAMIMVGLTSPETDTVLSRRVDCQELIVLWCSACRSLKRSTRWWTLLLL
jgi:hypothetical protein